MTSRSYLLLAIGLALIVLILVSSGVSYAANRNPYGGFNEWNSGHPSSTVVVHDASGKALCSLSVADGARSWQRTWHNYDCEDAGGKGEFVKFVRLGR